MPLSGAPSISTSWNSSASGLLSPVGNFSPPIRLMEVDQRGWKVGAFGVEVGEGCFKIIQLARREVSPMPKS